jgi:hypothetical protein
LTMLRTPNGKVAATTTRNLIAGGAAAFPFVAQPEHAAAVRPGRLSGVERTCRSSGRTSEFDPELTKLENCSMSASKENGRMFV